VGWKFNAVLYTRANDLSKLKAAAAAMISTSAAAHGRGVNVSQAVLAMACATLCSNTRQQGCSANAQDVKENRTVKQSNSSELPAC
jgi:hypothetical protein